MVLGRIGVTLAVVMFAFAPNFWAVLACYGVWAVSGALTSGSDVAFVHDSLEAQGRSGEFEESGRTRECSPDRGHGRQLDDRRAPGRDDQPHVHRHAQHRLRGSRGAGSLAFPRPRDTPHLSERPLRLAPPGGGAARVPCIPACAR